MTQVHKETLTSIENALPNRSNLDVEIFGMEGIPPDVVNSHNQRVVTQFAQAEAERRAATGNPGPGGVVGGATKKPKLEETSDLKKRLAEHKAKKAAEQATGVSSGDATPNGAGHRSQSPAVGPGQSPGYVSASYQYMGPLLTQNLGWLTSVSSATDAVWRSSKFDLCLLSSTVRTTANPISAAASIRSTKSISSAIPWL